MTEKEPAAELRAAVDWFWEQPLSTWSIASLTGRVLLVADSLDQRPGRSGVLVDMADHRQHGFSRKVVDPL